MTTVSLGAASRVLAARPGRVCRTVGFRIVTVVSLLGSAKLSEGASQVACLPAPLIIGRHYVVHLSRRRG